ncbi:28S ribosomal protein S36, mitochondrial [Zootermopsis nevadensis]|uniref:28S ribosomal protein S36, mitochondrial n=1 Tax=Zootermopsis nevadensis TaxID=136037 RepID=UPI000B8ED6E8|nr:28S ribosomal protein S36, mitochondrial [Zootermopsis nevadensis]
MAGISVARSWQVIRPHVPMIKFRKGGRLVAGSEGTVTPTPQHATGSAGAGKKTNIASRPVIEDYQLPLRYRRQPIDEKEIAYINRGGPE